ncbi:MAG: type II toxin-antitoxin system VapC family toxin [Candidatus Eremiobacteraeota bacterium]|nr:type II toxin-antitoxin system VapC family toxin [Candidatus Eremiobacteraeota bacterium]MBC5803281.1 type II toxin-antitoxin system VapC family toxin [Candidatus Eremiobacteraeota bacterium]MBC5822191.1 type II toxin-antitoxin system VapC family toxin [Candidatus Eremiobacteraeota bacterium]
MTIYADTSFLVTLYVEEDRTRESRRLLRRYKKPLSAIWFSLLEARNALRLLHFREQLDAKALAETLALLQESLAKRTIVAVPIDADELAARAEKISSRYTARRGLRTLDLIHVAAASLLTATNFLSYDERQRGVAEHIGLTVAP